MYLYDYVLYRYIRNLKNCFCLDDYKFHRNTVLSDSILFTEHIRICIKWQLNISHSDNRNYVTLLSNKKLTKCTY